MSLFVGVDGGGTNTRAVVIDENRNVLGEGVAGASNQNSVGTEAAKQAVLDSISKALKKSNKDVDKVEAICLCMSGVDRPNDILTVESWVESFFMPKTKCFVYNDAVAVLAGATDGVLNGIALISGTGTICLGIDKEGKQIRAQGWGPLLGDEGSGYQIGHHALRAIAAATDGLENETKLTELVLQRLGLQTPQELIPWAYDPKYNGAWDRVAALSRDVYYAYKLNDEAAIRIVNNAAFHLSDAVLCICKRLLENENTLKIRKKIDKSTIFDEATYNIVLAGGNLVNDDNTLRNAVQRLVEKRAPNCRVLSAEASSAVGAALVARQNFLQ